MAILIACCKIRILKCKFCCFAANKDKFPQMSSAQLNKLRHLTIVSLATKNKVRFNFFYTCSLLYIFRNKKLSCSSSTDIYLLNKNSSVFHFVWTFKIYFYFWFQCLPYTLLLKELEVSNLRELEVRTHSVCQTNLVSPQSHLCSAWSQPSQPNWVFFPHAPYSIHFKNAPYFFVQQLLGWSMLYEVSLGMHPYITFAYLCPTSISISGRFNLFSGRGQIQSDCWRKLNWKHKVPEIWEQGLKLLVQKS